MSPTPQTIRKTFQHRMEELRARLLHMGGLVEAAVHESLHAVLEREPARAETVIGGLEPEINELEREVDERVLSLLALQQPLAVDLRFAAAALKIGNELERMGDLAVNIAQGAERLLRQPLGPPLVDLPRMASQANAMLRMSLDALMRGDAELARQVLPADHAVDRLRDAIFHRLVEAMAQEPGRAELNLGLLFVARNLERIADHATNIAEDVIFWLEGTDVRHGHAAAPEA
ncbi:MAG TPA: phosphate signaling complex protein PhoU [Terriglobales bacterium]